MRKRTVAGLAGLAATVLLHFLVFTVALWGGGPHIRAPDTVGAGANAGQADGESIEHRMYVQLNLAEENTNPVPEPTPQLSEPQKQNTAVQITGPDAIRPPPLVVDVEGEATEASDADLIARTKLVGLYESQIRARIERAWTPPTESIRAPLYSCRVKIEQQKDGRVESVILDNCEGSVAWLDSLVKAIYSASPLPGAPHPGVFADSFSMQFRSAAVQSVP